MWSMTQTEWTNGGVRGLRASNCMHLMTCVMNVYPGSNQSMRNHEIRVAYENHSRDYWSYTGSTSYMMECHTIISLDNSMSDRGN